MNNFKELFNGLLNVGVTNNKVSVVLDTPASEYPLETYVHVYPLKTLRVTIKYLDQELHFEKECDRKGDFSKASWYQNAGTYNYKSKKSKKSKKPVKMLRIRLINVFLFEILDVERDQSFILVKEFEEQLNAIVDNSLKKGEITI